MSRINGEIMFHAIEPATEKALEPVLVCGTSYCPRAAERRWMRPLSWDTEVTNSKINSGAVHVTIKVRTGDWRA